MRVWGIVPQNAHDRPKGASGSPTRGSSGRMDGIGYIPTFCGGEHRSGTRQRAASL